MNGIGSLVDLSPGWGDQVTKITTLDYENHVLDRIPILLAPSVGKYVKWVLGRCSDFMK